MSSGIYEIRHVATGRRYIGQARDMVTRMRKHREALVSGRHANAKLQRAWSKHGGDEFAFRPLLICAEADLSYFEKRAIDGFDAVVGGFNISPVPMAPMAGRTMSAESRAKQSAALKGRAKSEAHKAKLAAALKGVKHPPDRVMKNAAAQARIRAETAARMMGNQNGRGHRHSAESKAKMAASWTPERRAQLSARMAARGGGGTLR